MASEGESFAAPSEAVIEPAMAEPIAAMVLTTLPLALLLNRAMSRHIAEE